MLHRTHTLFLTTSSLALLGGAAAYAAPSYVIDATSPSVFISETLTNASDNAVLIENGNTPISVTLTSTSALTGGGDTSPSVYIAESSQELILTQAPSATITGNNGAPAAVDTPGNSGSGGLFVYGLSTTLNLQGSITGGVGGNGGHGSVGIGQGGGVGGMALIITRSDASGSLALHGTGMQLTGGSGGNGGNGAGGQGGGNGGQGSFGIVGINYGVGHVVISGSVVQGGAGGNTGSFDGSNDTASGGQGGMGGLLAFNNSFNFTSAFSSYIGGAGGVGGSGGNGNTGLYLGGGSGGLTLNMTNDVITGGAGGNSALNNSSYAGEGGTALDLEIGSGTVNFTNLTVTGGSGGNGLGANDSHGGGGAALYMYTPSGSTVSIVSSTFVAGSNGHSISGNLSSASRGGRFDINDTSLTINRSTFIGGSRGSTSGTTVGLGSGGNGLYFNQQNSSILITGTTLIQGGRGAYTESSVLDQADMGGIGLTLQGTNGTYTFGSNTLIMGGAGGTNGLGQVGRGGMGVRLANGSMLATNYGTILSGGWGSLSNGAANDNYRTAAVYVTADNSTFINSGLVEGFSKGVLVEDAIGVTIHNHVGGVISATQLTDTLSGHAAVLGLEAAAFTLNNSGTIIGHGYAQGVRLLDSGTSLESLNNSGLIAVTGSGAVIEAKSAASIQRIINTGTISASTSSDYAITIQDTAEAGVELLNTGTINGHINIGRSNAATPISMTQAGIVNGNISILSEIGSTGDSFRFTNGTVNGNVTLSQNAWGVPVSTTLTSGTINGLLTLNGGTSALINPGANQTFTLNNVGSYAVMLDGAGIIKTGVGNFRLGGDISAYGTPSLTLVAGTTTLISDSTIYANIDLQGGALDVVSNTATLYGSLEAAAAASLRFNINGTSNGQLKLATDTDRTATLASGTIIQVYGTVQAGQTYTLLDATAAGGGSNLSAVASALVLSSTISGISNFRLETISDTLCLTYFTPTNTPTPQSTQTQTIFSQTSSAFSADSALLAALNGLTTSATLTTALSTLAPSDGGAPAAVANQVLDGVLGTVQSRIGEISSPDSGVATGDDLSALRANKTGVWLKGYGGTSKQDARGYGSGYAAVGRGFALGADAAVEIPYADDALVGVAVGYGTGSVNPYNSSNRVGVQSVQAIGYAAAHQDNWEGTLQASYAYNQFASRRVVQVGAITREAQGDYDGHQFNLQGEAAYRMRHEGWSLLPKVGVATVYATTADYTETGAGSANLNLDSTANVGLTTSAGLRLENTTALENGWLFTPQAEAMYSYDVLQGDIAQTARFASGGGTFTSLGTPSARHALKLNSGLKVKQENGFETTASYNAELRSGSQSHGLTVNLRYQF